MDNTVGLIVNPRSGGDVRRAVAAAARSTLEDKVSIVRRIVLGALATGIHEFYANYEPMQIIRRATETIRDINVTYVNDSMTFTEQYLPCLLMLTARRLLLLVLHPLQIWG